tara:strand:- start:252 stop:983 length:732 start_codon:yes stop_codon:yes gene_type:complete
LAVLTVAVALLPVGAGAADSTIESRMAGAETYDTVIYGGADYANGGSIEDDYGVDFGFVTALNGDIGTSGWVVTGNIGYGETDSIVDSDTFSTSLLLGYLWQMPDYYFTLSGGVHYVDNNDAVPGSPTDGSEVGVIGQYGFETSAVNAFYAQSYGSLSSVNDQAYGHVKAGYKTETLRFGGEFTVFDETASRPTLRYGAFLGDIPLGERVNMVVSAGYQQDLEPGNEDGFYTTIGFSIPFSLR